MTHATGMRNTTWSMVATAAVESHLVPAAVAGNLLVHNACFIMPCVCLTAQAPLCLSIGL